MIKYICFILLIFLLSCKTNKCFIEPSYPNGADELNNFIYKNLEWPDNFGHNGTVFLELTVNKIGEIEKIKILRSICKSCDEEAIRVMKLMPNWIVGKQNGRNVRVKFTIPVFFKLED